MIQDKAHKSKQKGLVLRALSAYQKGEDRFNSGWDILRFYNQNLIIVKDEFVLDFMLDMADTKYDYLVLRLAAIEGLEYNKNA